MVLRMLYWCLIKIFWKTKFSFEDLQWFTQLMFEGKMLMFWFLNSNTLIKDDSTIFQIFLVIFLKHTYIYIYIENRRTTLFRAPLATWVHRFSTNEEVSDRRHRRSIATIRANLKPAVKLHYWGNRDMRVRPNVQIRATKQILQATPLTHIVEPRC